MAKIYLVQDPENADRVYTEAVHGFDFQMMKDTVEEVDEKLMKKLQAASPFLIFTEKGTGKQVAAPKEPKLGGRKRKKGY